MDWGRTWLVDFNAGKTQLVSFDQSNKTGAIDVKMNEFVLEQKQYFNPIQNGGTKSLPPTSVSPVTSTNVEISPKNFLNFSFNPFATLV